MLKLATYVVLATAIIATSAAPSFAKSNGKARAVPPHANAMAIDSRSPVAGTRGANNKGLLPAGPGA